MWAIQHRWGDRVGDVRPIGGDWRAPCARAVDAELSFAGASVRGAAHAVNEDSWLAEPPVFLVADGMGGHEAGDRASAIIADEFARLIDAGQPDARAVRDCVARCHAQVLALSSGSARAPGSTLIAAVLLEHDGIPHWLIVNVGDSRAYRWTNGRVEQLSCDHSVVQELVDAGEIESVVARLHPERNVITRAIGIDNASEPDYSLIPVVAGTSLLLCSDGLTTEVDEAAIVGCFAQAANATDVARRLLDQAVEAGHRDDATVVVIEVRGALDQEGDQSGAGHQLTDVDTLPHGAPR